MFASRPQHVATIPGTLAVTCSFLAVVGEASVLQAAEEEACLHEEVQVAEGLHIEVEQHGLGVVEHRTAVAAEGHEEVQVVVEQNGLVVLVALVGDLHI